jgi:hypothetical protein
VLPKYCSSDYLLTHALLTHSWVLGLQQERVARELPHSIWPAARQPVWGSSWPRTAPKVWKLQEAGDKKPINKTRCAIFVHNLQKLTSCLTHTHQVIFTLIITKFQKEGQSTKGKHTVRIMATPSFAACPL